MICSYHLLYSNSLLISSETNEYEASSQLICGKQKSGRKGRKPLWSDNTLCDFVDIIINSEYYKKKLIFTNTKNQKNSVIYEKILTELKNRCGKRNETIDFTVVQMRNKFKKCISDCKHAAMTIKTATGISRFQEGKGYGAWFTQLFPLVQSRDSCKPEMAVEPSCSSSASYCSTSPNSMNDLEEDDQPDSLTNEGVKSFVPVKKRKLSAKDHVGEAVKLLKAISENDPSKELLKFMQDEAEKSRKHEIEMTKLLLNAAVPSNQPTKVPTQCSTMQF